MAEVQNLRKGDVFEEDKGLWRVIDHQHIKMGRGSATVRLKVRNVRTGSTIEKTYTNGARVQDVDLETFEYQYQYSDGDHYHFMNTETFEPLALTEGELEGIREYLLDGQVVMVEMFESEPVSLRLPTTVDLKVVWAEAAVLGDTAAGASVKEVELETGLRIQAPMYLKVGELIRVDTRTGTYVTRVKT
jgi:elongation factor P